MGDGLPGTPSKGATPKSAEKRARGVGYEAEDGDEEADTPSRKRRRVDTAIQSGPVTPSKSSRKQGFLDTVRGNSSQAARSKKQETRGDENNVPEYAMPAIRKLCNVFSTPQLAPHVYTGLCIVIKLSKLEIEDHDEETEMSKANVMSLIIALYLMVLTRMQKGKMTNKLYANTTAKGLEILELGSDHSNNRKIESWINNVNKKGWVKGQDWWDSVPEGVISGPKFTTKNNDDGLDAEDAEQEELSEDNVGDHIALTAAGSGEERRAELLKSLSDEDPEDVLLPGLGTMMSDSVDYFSEHRVKATTVWTKDVLARIAKLNKSMPSTPRRNKASAVAAA